MINTSIETMINLYTPNYNNLAKITKDVAAGAVLVTAIMSICVAGIIFLDFDRLFNCLFNILNNKFICVYYIMLIIISWVFVFKYPMRIRNRG